MAGHLGRLVILSPTCLPSAVTSSNCLRQRGFHSFRNIGKWASLYPNCLQRLPTNGNSSWNFVRNFVSELRFRSCHTAKIVNQAHAGILSLGMRTSRTVHGACLRGASPGMPRAGSLLGCRWISRGQREATRRRNTSVMLYGVALVILVTGFSYAAVPLYAVFCQATGLGGQATKGHNIDLVEDMVPVRGRTIAIRFNADTAASMRWNFRPQQLEIKVVPGETALAFYSAVNPTDKPITGISTYNVVPFEAGQYFNKIQCFCFEEQRLNPREQVDMPVFFYIDPEFAEDPKMAKVDSITLSYTFFEAKEGLVLPDPFTRPAESQALNIA